MRTDRVLAVSLDCCNPGGLPKYLRGRLPKYLGGVCPLQADPRSRQTSPPQKADPPVMSPVMQAGNRMAHAC